MITWISGGITVRSTLDNNDDDDGCRSSSSLEDCALLLLVGARCCLGISAESCRCCWFWICNFLWIFFLRDRVFEELMEVRAQKCDQPNGASSAKSTKKTDEGGIFQDVCREQQHAL